jgi:hypothetical protein
MYHLVYFMLNVVLFPAITGYVTEYIINDKGKAIPVTGRGGP